MTKINKLVMHGFKSFAKRTEVNFGNDFNCILGPNGSGKSNVLDALCFVLGKSSAKSLRAEKTSNLIYNGGKKKTPAKQAEVSIYFDNTSKIFPTEDKEVKISRIVKKSGAGVYKINDETRTRGQIIELLGLARVNPDGYNIILQGDIIRMIDMSPNERRGIIEEIAGISIYEEKKNKALKELDKVEGKLQEAQIVLQERESYLKELKKERDQAQKFKDLESQINVNKATHLHRRMTKFDAENEVFLERLGKEQVKLDKVTNEIQDLKKEIEEKKKTVDEINKEIEKRGEKDQITLHKEIEELKVKIATSQNRVESCKDEIAKIEQRKANLQEDTKEVEIKIKKAQEEMQSLNSREKAKSNELKELDEKIAAFRKKHKIEDASEIDQKIQDIDKTSESLQKEMQDMRSEQQELLREKDKLEFQLNSIDERIDKVLAVEKENKAQIQGLKSKKEEFKKVTLRLNSLITQDAALAQEIGIARRKLLEADEQRSKLNARQSQILERLGSDKAVTAILSNKNEFKGVHGTVSELGQVSKKYSLALEISAGNKLKSIVVDDDKVAAKCIKYIKENQLGVATFLPINKIRAPPKSEQAVKISKQSGAHGRAVDLVSFDPKFKDVFNYVFGNAVVVDDITVARKIGVGAAKMVTLDGDVTELSGAMQGGFRAKRQGLGFSEKEVTKGLEQAEALAADMGLRVSKLDKQRTENEEKIVQLRKEKAELEGEVIVVEKSLHLESGDLDVNKKIKENLKKDLQQMEDKVLDVQRTISQKSRSLADQKIAKEKLRNQLNELRNPRLQAELNNMEELKSRLKESVITLTSESKNFKTQIEAMLEPEKKNIEKAIQGHDKEKDQFNKEIGELSGTLKTVTAKLVEKEEKEKVFYAQFKEQFAQRQKLSDELNSQEKKLFADTDEQRKIEHKLNLIGIEKTKVDTELLVLREEFKQYEGVEIDHNKDDADLKKEIGQFERMVENLGAVNLKSLEIYDSVVKEYDNLMKKREDLGLEKQSVLDFMEEIEDKKKTLFMETFDVIQDHFVRIFSTLSTKGDASLILEDPENPFNGGLEIKVRLAGKKFLDIRSLSGGEKTMTALAFLFAVQEHEPAPFYILDEVDAALDKKNAQRLADLVKDYTGKAQYIMISHNDGVISEADVLFGVSMNEHGMTDVISLKI